MLLEAIESSMEHLRRWMPWAVHEPESPQAKARRLKKFRMEFDRGESYLYGIFNPDQSKVLGAVGAHGRIGAGAREIGYWIRADQINRGYCTEAAAAIVRIGMEMEKLRRIEIHCHPENHSSAAIPRKLGFEPALTIRNCVNDPKIGPRDTSIWVMSSDSYQSSRASTIPFNVVE